MGLAMILVCGCLSPRPEPVSYADSQPRIIRTYPTISPNFTWKIPSDFSTFGVQSKDSIRIAIFGLSVKRPGYYILPRGATVRGAIEAAQGLSGIVGWERPYSGIQRRRPDGSVLTIWFTSYKHQAEEEKLLLQDGDRVRISHEVY